MDIIRHNILFVLFFLVGTPASVQSETIEPLPYGDMDFWTTRIITKVTGIKTTHYPGTDKAEVFILLQYRWEDSKETSMPSVWGPHANAICTTPTDG
ncbi:MAG: hypothetical protein MR450_11890 [Prevotella sp.]|nr:hypothetical protein [Prevotella sp.]MDY4038852.1 hypothetical protein [Prevotella sp.]